TLLISEVVNKTSQIQWMSERETFTRPRDFGTEDVDSRAFDSKEKIQQSGAFDARQDRNFGGRAASNGNPKSLNSLKLELRLDKYWFRLAHRRRLKQQN